MQAVIQVIGIATIAVLMLGIIKHLVKIAMWLGVGLPSDIQDLYNCLNRQEKRLDEHLNRLNDIEHELRSNPRKK